MGDFPRKAEIIDFNEDQTTKERLLELGLFKGLEIQILGRAPFQGPWIIQFQTSLFALRDEELQCLKLKPK